MGQYHGGDPFNYYVEIITLKTKIVFVRQHPLHIFNNVEDLIKRLKDAGFYREFYNASRQAERYKISKVL